MSDIARPPSRFAFALRCACDTARLMVGQPSYETYVQHMAQQHPEQTPMTYPEFFRNRQDARFARGSGKFSCC